MIGVFPLTVFAQWDLGPVGTVHGKIDDEAAIAVGSAVELHEPEGRCRDRTARAASQAQRRQALPIGAQVKPQGRMVPIRWLDEVNREVFRTL